MYLKKYNLLIFFLYMLSLFFFYNMNSYYSIWIFMELNLLMFLMILVLNSEFLYDELIKYFLMSSFSSIIFMFFYNLYFMNYMLIMIYLINLSMFIKLGMIPFHLWFIDLMQSLNWIMCFFLSVVQKIIPLMILINFYNNYMYVLLILLNGFFSMFFIFNQIFLKKLMGYSSINHMCWILFSLMISLKIFKIYYFSYFVINLLIMMFMYIYNMNEIIDLYQYYYMSDFKIYWMFLFFSLGGLPPFFGFLMKWMMILNMIYYKNWLMMYLLMMFSLYFLFYYLRLLLNLMMIYYMSLNLNFMFKILILKNVNLMYLMIYLFSILNLFIIMMYLFF